MQIFRGHNQSILHCTFEKDDQVSQFWCEGWFVSASHCLWKKHSSFLTTIHFENCLVILSQDIENPILKLTIVSILLKIYAFWWQRSVLFMLSYQSFYTTYYSSLFAYLFISFHASFYASLHASMQTVCNIE